MSCVINPYCFRFIYVVVAVADVVAKTPYVRREPNLGFGITLITQYHNE